MVRSFFILVCIISFGCNPSTKKEEKTGAKKPEVDKTEVFKKDSIAITNAGIDGWIAKTLNKDRIDFEHLQLAEYEQNDSTMEDFVDVSKEFFQNYATVLRWSPDSLYVLDIGSYGSVLVKDKNGKTAVEAGEPDTEVALIIPSTKTRRSLFFVGPSSDIFDAKWVNKKEAVILGSFDELGNGKPDTLFWLVDMKDNIYRLYKWK